MKNFLPKDKTFIIAELSANHNKNYDIAARTIESIAKSGADAVKFQTYTASSITIDSKLPHFMARKSTIWAGRSIFDVFKDGEMNYNWYAKLFKLAEDNGLQFFSTPFDFKDVDFLEELKVPAYKIASIEIGFIPLIKYIAKLQKPIIFSTGVANLSDIELAVKTCTDEKNSKLALLKCTTSYPAPLSEINLKNIPTLIQTFGFPVGLSDHTMSIAAPVAAVALGAKIIEKHFILDRNNGGIDSSFSLEPSEFETMVENVRQIELMLGEKKYTLGEKAFSARKVMRSLFVVENIKKGELFTKNNIRAIRPGLGIHPKHYTSVIGKRATINIEKGTPLSLDLISF